MAVRPHESHWYSCPPRTDVRHAAMRFITTYWRSVAPRRARYPLPNALKIAPSVALMCTGYFAGAGTGAVSSDAPLPDASSPGAASRGLVTSRMRLVLVRA